MKRNNGAPGIDGETVSNFESELELNIEFLHEILKTNTYETSPARRVEIEKPDGGVRLLGIPTVRDRVVQQAVVNIIEPIYDETFHPSSYGYRPNKSQHQAVAKAERFMNKYGLTHVVDMDLSKCFDTLDHGIMMKAVAELISDGRVLNLIEKFLKSGVMQNNNFYETEVGSPQGGVISPLLSNIYLNMRGWINYYRVANIKGIIADLMGWIRRRLRMIKLRHWKSYKAMHKEMHKQGIKGNGEKMAMTKWICLANGYKLNTLFDFACIICYYNVYNSNENGYIKITNKAGVIPWNIRDMENTS